MCKYSAAAANCQPIAQAHHRVQVGEPLHQSRFLGKLLPECIAKVMCRIRGYDQHALSVLCQLHCQAAAASGLADTTLAADPNPFQACLIKDILQGGLWGVIHFHTECLGFVLGVSKQQSERQSSLKVNYYNKVVASVRELDIGEWLVIQLEHGCPMQNRCNYVAVVLIEFSLLTYKAGMKPPGVIVV
jgi:hypothetical protein